MTTSIVGATAAGLGGITPTQAYRDLRKKFPSLMTAAERKLQSRKQRLEEQIRFLERSGKSAMTQRSELANVYTALRPFKDDPLLKSTQSEKQRFQKYLELSQRPTGSLELQLYNSNIDLKDYRNETLSGRKGGFSGRTVRMADGSTELWDSVTAQIARIIGIRTWDVPRLIGELSQKGRVEQGTGQATQSPEPLARIVRSLKHASEVETKRRGGLSGTIESAMISIEAKIGNRLNEGQRRVIKAYLLALGGHDQIENKHVHMALRLAGIGDYEYMRRQAVKAEGKRLYEMLPFSPAELQRSVDFGLRSVTTKAGGEIGMRNAMQRWADAGMGQLAITNRYKLDDPLTYYTDFNRLANPEEVIRSSGRPYVQGIKSNPERARIVPFGVDLPGLVFKGILEGELDKHPNLSPKERAAFLRDELDTPVLRTSNAVSNLARYLIPGIGQVSATTDNLVIAQRISEVGAERTGKELVEGFIDSINVFDEKASTGERVVKGINGLLALLGVTAASVKLYQKGVRLPAAIEISKRRSIPLNDAMRLIEESEAHAKKYILEQEAIKISASNPLFSPSLSANYGRVAENSGSTKYKHSMPPKRDARSVSATPTKITYQDQIKAGQFLENYGRAKNSSSNSLYGSGQSPKSETIFPGSDFHPWEGAVPAIRTYLGGRVKVLFNSVKEGLVREGVKKVIGLPATTAQHILEAVHIIRDAAIEKTFIVYMKDGKVVDVEVYSLRLPGSTKRIEADHVNARSRALGADGVWIGHNHPGGWPRVSENDLKRATENRSEIVGYKGDLITNHTKAVHITPFAEEKWLDVGFPNLRKDHSEWPSWYQSVNPRSTKLDHLPEVGQVIRSIKSISDNIVAVGTTSENELATMLSLDRSLFDGNHNTKLNAAISHGARNSGSHSVMLYVPGHVFDRMTLSERRILSWLYERNVISKLFTSEGADLTKVLDASNGGLLSAYERKNKHYLGHNPEKLHSRAMRRGGR